MNIWTYLQYCNRLYEIYGLTLNSNKKSDTIQIDE